MNQSNPTLAKRIADLERQLSSTKDLLESSMLSEAAAKQYAEEVDKQNQALAAQVEALHKAIETALHGTVFDEVGNRDDDGLIPFHETKTAVIVLQNALAATPQHHLRQVRADAGRDGFIAGYMLCNDDSPLIKHNYEGFANQYHASILAGKE